MKTVVSILLIPLCFMQFPLRAQNHLYDSLKHFRGIPFGSTVEFVRENETAPYLQSFKGFGTFAVSFSGDFKGYKARIDYSFKDNDFVEGAYIIDDIGNIKVAFSNLRNELIRLFGSPDYWANSLIGYNKAWIKVNDFGLYKGPELYWQFINGFVALHASRFKEDQTITILFVVNKSIPDYNSNTFNEFNR